MGHDITAYLGRVRPGDLGSAAGRHELGERIASLRRSAGRRGAVALYAALDAERYDAGVSGVGIGRWFTRGQLHRAAERLWGRVDRSRVVPAELRPPPGSLVELHYGDVPPEIPAPDRELEFVSDCLARLPADQDVVYIEFG
jgi:hypothetical protein